MTINEYQRQALRTEAPEGVYTAAGDVLRAFLLSRGQIAQDEITSIMRLLEGLMGVNGEAGEAVDILKKVLFQGHKLDREYIALELGDICWYIALAADAIGYPLEEIMAMNLEKLRKRYPDGFAVNRSVERERRMIFEMFKVDILFTSGDNLRLKSIESFYYDETSQCFVLKDDTGFGYFPRENIRMITKNEG